MVRPAPVTGRTRRSGRFAVFIAAAEARGVERNPYRASIPATA